MSDNNSQELYSHIRCPDDVESPRKRMRVDNSSRRSWSLMDRKTDTEVLQEMGVSILEADEADHQMDTLPSRSVKRRHTRDLENVNPNVPSSPARASPRKHSPRDKGLPLSPASADTSLGTKQFLVEEETPLGQSVSGGGYSYMLACERTDRQTSRLEDGVSPPAPSPRRSAAPAPAPSPAPPGSRTDSFSLLSDEVMLSVLRWLPKRTLAHCMTLSKRSVHYTMLVPHGLRRDAVAATGPREQNVDQRGVGTDSAEEAECAATSQLRDRGVAPPHAPSPVAHPVPRPEHVLGGQRHADASAASLSSAAETESRECVCRGVHVSRDSGVPPPGDVEPVDVRGTVPRGALPSAHPVPPAGAQRGVVRAQRGLPGGAGVARPPTHTTTERRGGEAHDRRHAEPAVVSLQSTAGVGSVGLLPDHVGGSQRGASLSSVGARGSQSVLPAAGGTSRQAERDALAAVCGGVGHVARDLAERTARRAARGQRQPLHVQCHRSPHRGVEEDLGLGAADQRPLLGLSPHTPGAADQRPLLGLSPHTPIASPNTLSSLCGRYGHSNSMVTWCEFTNHRLMWILLVLAATYRNMPMKVKQSSYQTK